MAICPPTDMQGIAAVTDMNAPHNLTVTTPELDESPNSSDMKTNRNQLQHFQALYTHRDL